MIEGTNTVDKAFLFGTKKRVCQEVNIPKVRKQTNLEWSEWRDFIWRNFLSGKYQVTQPPGERILQQVYAPTTEIQLLHNMKWDGTWVETIKNLPPVWRQILGKIKAPVDNGKMIQEKSLNGTLVGASDGSVKQGKDVDAGGYAYTVQLWETDTYGITGYAPCPSSTKVTSLTAELYGLIASTLVVFMLGKKISGGRTSRTITLSADNEQAIKMGQDWKTPINISETTQHEYDLWKLMWNLAQESNIKIEYQWVRGHQDTLKTGERIFGPFPRLVQLNIEMDDRAKDAADIAQVHTLR